MSEKLTEYELYIQQAIESHGGLKELTILSVDSALHLSDLRAKEAVEKFARELIEYNTKHGRSSFEITMIAKQNGVEL